MEVDVMKTNYTLIILALAIIVMIPISSLLATSGDENCIDIDIDCLKERLKQMCREGAVPSYPDCENILGYGYKYFIYNTIHYVYINGART
jgi:hypothetical protein